MGSIEQQIKGAINQAINAAIVCEGKLGTTPDEAFWARLQAEFAALPFPGEGE